MKPKGEMYEFTQKQLELYSKPCVYFAYIGDEVVYIGMSSFGAARAFDARKHHVLKKIEGLFNLTFLTFETSEEAFNAETALIDSLQPRFNRPRRPPVATESPSNG